MDNNAYGESNQGFDNQIIQPPPDSVANFEVITNNESAEYGRSSGATVNVATKSGSNQFHATLYEFIRNTDLNAFGYIKPISVNAVTGKQYPFFKPIFNRNQFGANFGGPVISNRFFWFVDYEGFRQTLTPTVIDTVPTTNELNGSLAVAVQDPWSPGTYIPAGTPYSSWPTQAKADADPTALKIASLYLGALPGKCTVTSGTSSGVATNDCPLNAPFTDHADKGDLRLDFQQNANTSWFLKVSDRKEIGHNNNLLPEPIDMQTNGDILIHDEQVAAGYNHAFSANKFLDARLALSETKAGKWTYAIGSTSFPAGTIPGLPTIGGVSGGLPSIAISGGFTSFGRQSTNPQWQYPSLVDPKLNFSWVHGHHSLKFGYEWEKVWQEIQDSNPLYGSFTYGSGYSVCPTSAGSSCPSTSKVGDTYWADFLFGTSSAYSLSTYFITHVYQEMDSAYAQDDWKVSSKLTLNIGLRWEYGSPWWERDNFVSNFNPTTGTMQTLHAWLDDCPVSSVRRRCLHLSLQQRQRRIWQVAGQSKQERLVAALWICCRSHAEPRSPRRLRHGIHPLLACGLRQQSCHQRALRSLYRRQQPLYRRNHKRFRKAVAGLPHGAGNGLQRRHGRHRLYTAQHEGRIRRELVPRCAEGPGQEHQG